MASWSATLVECDALPLALVAELTHSCPLSCLYCSNELNLVRRADELDTAAWVDVIAQAAALGVVQLHLTGGEPLAHPGLAQLIACAARLDLYTNMITSGVGADASTIESVLAARPDHVQLSVQSTREDRLQVISGTRSLFAKEKFAGMVKESGLPLTLNVVVHKLNLDELPELVELALDWGARRLELANAQYYGFALANRDHLLPDAAALLGFERQLAQLKAATAGRLEILYVASDYLDGQAKPCAGGWGRRQLVVKPDGRVAPCHMAHVISDLELESVSSRSLAWIWEHSSSFNRFRGFDWMSEPCRSCQFKESDFGGCRCQAFLLTGQSELTDPVCTLGRQREIFVPSPPDPVLRRPML